MAIKTLTIPVIFELGLPPFQAGDKLIVQADAERSTVADGYVKLKEIRVASSGTIRVCFDLKQTSALYSAYGRIYKNGVALGTERSNQSETYITYTEDLAFLSDDLVQLYCHKTGAEGAAWCRNFQLKANRYHLHAILTD